ncbi:transmembrane protein, putative (macronuclear) [Tetrahymena thermophila SB210]|uniref:Transmembrane protein, putative n=1 Tax=Tetrahymena thermophila (strain SB210) TaxID=312017 RepID=W7X3K3_TETTS|nr:transmembrane protein, putative [Tetrahymena thermophila SB210]EWS73875.1 transmembrane protein, putative [Tetrahymena thermophila SB210]|eukprot:XP_012653622.1 transmembrane protein, putative [Tetrahymena thermophila SB210]
MSFLKLHKLKKLRIESKQCTQKILTVNGPMKDPNEEPKINILEAILLHLFLSGLSIKHILFSNTSLSIINWFNSGIIGNKHMDEEIFVKHQPMVTTYHQFKLTPIMVSIQDSGAQNSIPITEIKIPIVKKAFLFIYLDIKGNKNKKIMQNIELRVQKYPINSDVKPSPQICAAYKGVIKDQAVEIPMDTKNVENIFLSVKYLQYSLVSIELFFFIFFGRYLTAIKLSKKIELIVQKGIKSPIKEQHI